MAYSDLDDVDYLVEDNVMDEFAHLHRPSLFIMVVCCVARILDTDVGKTLMNMEMLPRLDNMVHGFQSSEELIAMTP